MRLHRYFTLAALATLSTLAYVAPASAFFEVCNRTSYPLEVAFGYRDGATWMSKGWWRIPTEKVNKEGFCQIIHAKPLTDDEYYFYAIGPADSMLIWDGEENFCVADDIFEIEGRNCDADESFDEEGFMRADVGDKQEYTIDLTAAEDEAE